jgi:hypothetical protein
MPEFQKDEFQFPDEKGRTEELVVQRSDDDFDVKVEVEIEDDTPPDDRDRDPMPRAVVEELEQDELDAYDEKVKEKLKQMKKVWHDERREKEAALREHQEAISLAQRLIDENKKYRSMLDSGGKEYASTLQSAASMQLEMAKRAYKEAYDSGDADRLVEAQQAMQEANIRVFQAQNFRMPALQDEEIEVQQVEEPVNRPNPRLSAWQERNPWYGPEPVMTALALGYHKKLRDSGRVVVGSEEYFAELDREVRRRFPEYFTTEETEEVKARPESARSKPSTVVAPAMRSTSSNKIKLRASQVTLAKKLGLTPEQYAIALRKLEMQNG